MTDRDDEIRHRVYDNLALITNDELPADMDGAPYPDGVLDVDVRKVAAQWNVRVTAFASTPVPQAVYRQAAETGLEHMMLARGDGRAVKLDFVSYGRGEVEGVAVEYREFVEGTGRPDVIETI